MFRHVRVPNNVGHANQCRLDPAFCHFFGRLFQDFHAPDPRRVDRVARPMQVEYVRNPISQECSDVREEPERRGQFPVAPDRLAVADARRGVHGSL